MHPSLRRDFNQRFQPSAHARLLENLRRRCGSDIPFRVSETPCFVPRALMDTMVTAGVELSLQLVHGPAYLQHSTRAIPECYRFPHEARRPLFVQIDFGFIRHEDGGLAPRLVELQGFPSLMGFGQVLGEESQSCHGLDPGLRYLLSDRTPEEYWERLRALVLAGHEPRHVVLADVHPETQKTLPDFNVLHERLGLPVVDITRLIREDRRLFYRDGAGRLVPIHRVHNRAIMDELEREHRTLPFDPREELQVEWAGHPNWYFRMSKFSLPFLAHPTVPRAVFLDELEQKRDLLPERRGDWVLKPLFSFGGQGIVFGPTDAQLAAIPEAERCGYLLEERVPFEPVVDTPHGPTQAEIRVLYVWPDEEPEPRPLLCLARMGRGRMMGTQHNREEPWVGASSVFTEGG